MTNELARPGPSGNDISQSTFLVSRRRRRIGLTVCFHVYSLITRNYRHIATFHVATGSHAGHTTTKIFLKSRAH